MKRNFPLVSIICSCYNQAPFVLEALESVKSQTYSNLEIIIWDDVSKDDSVHLIENWILENPQLDIQFVKHTQNMGICKSLNECFLLTKGKYIQILALDDVLMVDKIEKHVALIEKELEECALVFSDAYVINENSQIVENTSFIQMCRKDLVLKPKANYFDILMDGNFIPGMSVLLRKSAVEGVGLFDENISFEDFDMWLRLSEKFDFIYDNNLTVKYRIHSSNTHKNTTVMENGMFETYLKHSHPIARKRANLILKNIYLRGQIGNESKRFFAKYAPNTIPDYLVKMNAPISIYKLLIKISSIISKIRS